MTGDLVVLVVVAAVVVVAVVVAHLGVVVDVEVRWFTLEWPPAQEVRHQQQGKGTLSPKLRGKTPLSSSHSGENVVHSIKITS